jgi:hypothetical protein
MERPWDLDSGYLNSSSSSASGKLCDVMEPHVLTHKLGALPCLNIMVSLMQVNKCKSF